MACFRADLLGVLKCLCSHVRSVLTCFACFRAHMHARVLAVFIGLICFTFQKFQKILFSKINFYCLMEHIFGLPPFYFYWYIFERNNAVNSNEIISKIIQNLYTLSFEIVGLIVLTCIYWQPIYYTLLSTP